MNEPAVMILLDALACYRLTRLVTTDTILHAPRERFVEAAYVRAGLAEERRDQAESSSWAEVATDDEPEAPKLATLITCRWCTGVWVALGVVAARRIAPRVWDPVARALALSSAAALVAGLEQD